MKTFVPKLGNVFGKKPTRKIAGKGNETRTRPKRPLKAHLDFNGKEIKHDWLLVDAKDQVLGRVASQIAYLLRGKHKTTWTPNFDTGDFVVVINIDKVKMTGQKHDDKLHYWHTGYIGHIRNVSYGELLKNKPEFMFRLVVKRMLPRNKLRSSFLSKLKVYTGAEHPHAAQQPIPVEWQKGRLIGGRRNG